GQPPSQDRADMRGILPASTVSLLPARLPHAFLHARSFTGLAAWPQPNASQLPDIPWPRGSSRPLILAWHTACSCSAPPSSTEKKREKTAQFSSGKLPPALPEVRRGSSEQHGVARGR